MQLLDRGEVFGPSCPDLDRGTVGQQSIGAGLSLCAYLASLAAAARWPRLTRIMEHDVGAGVTAG
jgi:hypothetical protein